MKEYRMPAREGRSEETVKRSVFLGGAFPVTTEDEALARIAEEKKRHPDARHCAWAYILGEAGDRLRYADDGEPQGTAGQPILNAIRARGLTNTLVCVTRYFGGILLGTGGLTRAYASGAAGALDAAGTAVMKPTVRTVFSVDYPHLARLQNLLDKDDGIRIENTDFSLAVTLTLLVQCDHWDAFFSRMTDLFCGAISPEKKELLFLPWEG